MVDFYTDVRPDTAQQHTTHTHMSIRVYFVQHIHTGVRPFAVVFVIAAPYAGGCIGACVWMCARMCVFRMYVLKGCSNRRCSWWVHDTYQFALARDYGSHEIWLMSQRIRMRAVPWYKYITGSGSVLVLLTFTRKTQTQLHRHTWRQPSKN